MRDPRRYEADLVRAANAEREEHGLAALPASSCAAEQARTRAAALRNAATLTHAPLADVIRACGADSFASENLSRGSPDEQRVVDAWMASPGHRANLLDPDAAEVGAGCVGVGRDSFVCSLIFIG